MYNKSIQSFDSQLDADFISEFGNILAKGLWQENQEHIFDVASANFARFLRATRTARGLSRLDLAGQSGLSEAQLVALEKGIFFSENIPTRWLYALAESLGERPTTLGFMLEREIPQVGISGVKTELRRIWQVLATFVGENKISISFLTSVIVAFAFLVLFDFPVTNHSTSNVTPQLLQRLGIYIVYVVLGLVLAWIWLPTNNSLLLQSRLLRQISLARKKIVFTTSFVVVFLAIAQFISITQTVAPTQAIERQVYYASQNIPQGTTITQEMLDTFAIPQDNAAEVMFTLGEEANLVGQTARFTLDQGTLITSSMVGADPGELPGPAWAVQVPSGMVAVAIPTNRLATAAYGVNDGAHVNVTICMTFVDVDPAWQSVLPNYVSAMRDIFSSPEGADRPYISIEPTTLELPSRQGRVELDPTFQKPIYTVPSEVQRPRLVCQMILQDVVVMNLGNFQLQVPVAADPNTTLSPAQNQQEMAPDIITLIVTPQDSIALNYFVYSGAVMSMTLRNPNDNSRIEAQSATLTSLLTQYNISLPSKLPYAQQPLLDVLAPPLLPNDIINVRPQ